ncbi:uncharacterized protein LOC123555686 [Mercenaria mercenaria]|uniref:uncharacterized protein LOC123555686 n=1 Tax=Mercenaria mercenaria TaxID=6596 RepID=UPI00234E67B1|nr:uncharacterized protein LOC123555686 [Mercenaria mercenaria]
MALSYQFDGAVIILILFVSSGVILAEQALPLPTESSDGKEVTSEPTPTVKSNISEPKHSPDDSTTQSTKPDSQEEASTATEPSKNDPDTVTQNPSVQQNSSKASTQKEAIDTTQNPNLHKDITESKSETTDNKIPQSNSNDTGNKSGETPSQVDTTTSDTKQDKKNKTNTGSDVTTQFMPVTFDTRWMDTFIHTHHFEGQYTFNGVRYLFDFVIRYKHPSDPRTLVTNFYDADGAVLEFNGTSADGHVIVFTLSKIYTPGVRFPLQEPLEVTGSFPRTDQPYFTGNFTKPINSSFSWFHMNKGLGAIETGETAGTRTAIVIIIPTSIAFLGICGTVAIICWASKKGYLRGRHKSYRLFTDAQVSYESEAETIHI